MHPEPASPPLLHAGRPRRGRTILLRPIGASLLFLSAFALASCCGSPPPRGDATTPKGTVQQFQRAIAEEDSLGLYGTLAEDFKQANQLDALTTDLALEHLLDEYPEVSYLGSGEIVATERLSEHLSTVDVEAGALWITRRVRFVLHRATLAELRFEGIETPHSVYLEPGVRVRNRLAVVGDDQTFGFSVVSEDLYEQVADPEAELTAFHLQDVWKVLHLGLLEEGQPDPAEPFRSKPAEEAPQPTGSP